MNHPSLLEVLTWFNHIDTSMANILFSSDSRGMGFPTGSKRDHSPVTPMIVQKKPPEIKNDNILK